jgi:toxin ParE1/3/4
MRVRWFHRAVSDLEELRTFIEQDNPPAAIEQVIKIVDAVEGTLADHPQAGRPGRLHGTREIVVSGTPYLVAYRVRAGTVEVLRVLHSSRRWPGSVRGRGEKG